MWETLDCARREALIAHLLEFVTPHKRARMEAVMALRTKALTVVLEDIFQPQNASAIMRTSECFGLQEMHIIENRHRFSPNLDVALGAQKWLRLHRYRKPNSPNSLQCLEKLRLQGYRIIATTLSSTALPLPEIPLSPRMALCFGTEEEGLSPEILENADLHLRIPMYGFTQSFNVSVSAALCLHDLRTRLQAANLPLALSPADRQEAYFHWLKKSVRHWPLHLRKFLKESENSPSSSS